MFWTEEDISPVAHAAERVLGVNGNMSNEPSAAKNVVVCSPKFGKIWYGDVDGGQSEVVRKVALLSKQTNEPFFLEVMK
jgi:hypothetical protein